MPWTTDPREGLRATPDAGTTFDCDATPGFHGGKEAAEELMTVRGELLAQLQERFYAEGRAGGGRSVLCVVQGLDTSGKGGIAKHVMGLVDPQGVQLHSFGVPTAEEAAHHFLWRIRKALPRPGRIGLFDRSHYEDVLVQRVDRLVPEDVWRARYDEINDFEAELTDGGTTVLKFALMVGYDEQAERLMERLDRPDKHWKYSPGDLTTRANWPDYQEAYADVFRFTSTQVAPWYVIPANRKWFARLAVTEILTRTLVDMQTQWPDATFDVAEQRALLASTMSAAALERSLSGTEALIRKAIAKSIDVRHEIIELCGGGAEHLEKAEAKREDWHAQMVEAVEQKRQLLQSSVPGPAQKKP